MIISKVVKKQKTKKGYSQLGIPEAMIDACDLRESDFLKLIATDDGIRIVPASRGGRK